MAIEKLTAYSIRLKLDNNLTDFLNKLFKNLALVKSFVFTFFILFKDWSNSSKV